MFSSVTQSESAVCLDACSNFDLLPTTCKLLTAQTTDGNPLCSVTDMVDHLTDDKLWRELELEDEWRIRNDTMKCRQKCARPCSGTEYTVELTAVRYVELVCIE